MSMEENKTNSLGKKIAKNVDVRCSAAGWAKSIVIQKALEEYFKKYEEKEDPRLR